MRRETSSVEISGKTEDQAEAEELGRPPAMPDFIVTCRAQAQQQHFADSGEKLAGLFESFPFLLVSRER